ncbi:PQQ-dependent sugar dehydrogenase [Arthrobacter sp. NPDC057009]|uniref:PQQ-dependent sugar dehydrogenase n=1 Tax=Arthrobacter sp. NPDC057009 TaxID=3345996 RepID=UPI00362605C8
MRRNHPVQAAAAALAMSALTMSLSACTGDGGAPAPGSTPPTTGGATSASAPAPTTQGTSSSPAAPSPPQAPEVRGRIEGLQIPWSTVFLPDGTAVISERDTALLKSVTDGRVGTIGAVPGVVPGGEGGLMGLALSPDFASDRYLYAYFTAADDNQGRLWASEFGPDVNDELNLIQPGGNYGWPEVTGAPHRDGFIDAETVWPSTADSSPSGLEIVGNTAYLGALRGQRIWAVPLAGENAGDPVGYFTREFGRIRNVSLAPNGDLWALSNNQNPDFALILRLPR